MKPRHCLLHGYLQISNFVRPHYLLLRSPQPFADLSLLRQSPLLVAIKHTQSFCASPYVSPAVALSFRLRGDLPKSWTDLALAQLTNSPFWTADERLYNAVSGSLPWVRWVGNLSEA
jgi:hypothetical protein